MAPSKVGLSTTPALNLEEVLPTSDNLERVYKFGAENNNKTLYAKDGDATGINKAFTITMETSAAIGATVDVWYSQDGITRTLYT